MESAGADPDKAGSGGVDVGADRAAAGLGGLNRADISGADLGPSIGGSGFGGGLGPLGDVNAAGPAPNPIAQSLQNYVGNLSWGSLLGRLLGMATPIPGGAMLGSALGSRLLPGKLRDTPSFGAAPGGPTGATLAGGGLGGSNLGSMAAPQGTEAIASLMQNPQIAQLLMSNPQVLAHLLSLSPSA